MQPHDPELLPVPPQCPDGGHALSRRVEVPTCAKGSFFQATGHRVFSALPSREVSRGRSFGADKDHRKHRRVDGREAVLDHSGRGPLSPPSFQVMLFLDVR